MELDWINDNEFTRSLIDACPQFNRGYTAGRISSTANLGAEGSPFQVTKENIIHLLSYAEIVVEEGMNGIEDLFLILSPVLASWIPIWMVKIRPPEESMKVRGFDFNFFISSRQPIQVDPLTCQTCHYLFFGALEAIKDKKLVRSDWLGQIYCSM